MIWIRLVPVRCLPHPIATPLLPPRLAPHPFTPATHSPTVCHGSVGWLVICSPAPPAAFPTTHTFACLLAPHYHTFISFTHSRLSLPLIPFYTHLYTYFTLHTHTLYCFNTLLPSSPFAYTPCTTTHHIPSPPCPHTPTCNFRLGLGLIDFGGWFTTAFVQPQPLPLQFIPFYCPSSPLCASLCPTFPHLYPFLLLAVCVLPSPL